MHAELVDFKTDYDCRKSKRKDKNEKFEEVALNEANPRSAKA